jgi:hypothetical protein
MDCLRSVQTDIRRCARNSLPTISERYQADPITVDQFSIIFPSCSSIGW